MKRTERQDGSYRVTIQARHDLSREEMVLALAVCWASNPAENREGPWYCPDRPTTKRAIMIGVRAELAATGSGCYEYGDEATEESKTWADFAVTEILGWPPSTPSPCGMSPQRDEEKES